MKFIKNEMVFRGNMEHIRGKETKKKEETNRDIYHCADVEKIIRT